MLTGTATVGMRWIAPIFLLLFASCHLGLVAEYDENFVKAASDLQKDIDGFLQNLKSPPHQDTDLTFSGNIGVYNRFHVAINALMVLARSHEKNEPTIDQVNSLSRLVNAMEQLHKTQAKLSAAFIDLQREQFLIAFSSMIRTENDKKAAT